MRMLCRGRRKFLLPLHMLFGVSILFISTNLLLKSLSSLFIFLYYLGMRETYCLSTYVFALCVFVLLYFRGRVGSIFLFCRSVLIVFGIVSAMYYVLYTVWAEWFHFLAQLHLLGRI